MKLYEQKKYTDIESQYGDHNTVVEGFNDGLPETFKDNMYKERPILDKWTSLRNLMKAEMSHVVHYSHDKRYEHSVTERYLKYMDELDERDRREKNKQSVTIEHVQRMAAKPTGFLYTDVPEFDKEQWEKMLKNLEGLA